MSNTDNLTQRLRRAVDHALTFSDDVVDDRAVPFDDLAMRDRALSAFDAELRLHAPTEPLQPEGEQVKTAILKVISGSDQWLFYDRRIGHTQRSDFADQVVALLDETGAQNGSGDETAKAVAREVINNAALPAGAVINAVEVDALYEGIVNALSTIHYPYVLRLARGIQRKYYAHVQGWEPLPTTDGVLSQIDNMIEGLPLAAMSPATPSDAAIRAAEDVTCPFCRESDFDLIGLKFHLGSCEAFNEVQAISNPMVESGVSAPTVTADQVKAAAESIAKRYAVSKSSVAVIEAIITRHLAAADAPETVELQIARRFLVKMGYARCASAACGCNSWHERRP